MRLANTVRWPTQAEAAPRRAASRAPGALVHAQPHAQTERARRRVVALVFLIYLLVIAEGSLRKWVLPQFGLYIFFIRDPFLLLAYLLATRHALWPRESVFFNISLLMGGLGLLLAVLQAATGGFSETRLLLAVYGWRNYFLYVPLAFLVGAQFRASDLLRLFKLTLALAVPIALLVAAQFFSPQGAAINVGSAVEEELQFRGVGLNAEHTRPMGPFSSVAGQQQFVTTACAIVLAFFIAPKAIRRPSFAFLVVAAGGVLTCVALGGSRGTVLQCGLSLVFALAVGLLGRGAALKGRALLWPLALGSAAIMLYPVLFPEGFAAFSERWEVAHRLESRSFDGAVFGRALFGLIDFVRLIEAVPTLGYGLGYGGNASNTLHATVDGVLPSSLAETDFARHMVDLGPLFGIGYIVFRLALVGWLAALVLRSTRRAADPMPMLLLSYVAYVVVLGQITGQGAINLYGWLFTGLLIAACNAAQATQAAQRRLRPPPFPLRRTLAARAPPGRRHTSSAPQGGRNTWGGPAFVSQEARDE